MPLYDSTGVLRPDLVPQVNEPRLAVPCGTGTVRIDGVSLAGASRSPIVGRL